MKSIDIIIPVFNEQDCLVELLSRLEKLKKDLSLFQIHYIFVNDGSIDESSSILNRYALEWNYLKIINFSRNFGHQFAITAGLDYSTADYVLIIDADLQDPPELLVEMVKIAESGFDIVYGKRVGRKGESIIKLLTAKLFYKILNHLCSIAIPSDTGDFRLITRKVVVAFQSMREQHRFVRGMIPWVGFKSTPLLYQREERYAGTTKYPISKMIKFAADAIFSFSNAPIRLAIYLGLFIVFLGLIVAILMVYLKLCTTFTVPGISAVIISVMIIGGFQIAMLGVIGEYVGKIFEQSKQRPLYIVGETVNIQTK